MLWLLWAALGAVILLALFVSVRRLRSSATEGSSRPDIPLVAPLPARPGRSAPAAPTVAPSGGELYDGRTIRFYRPPAETLQLAPGRLEVVAGEERVEEIRFVRQPGPRTEITLGRREGEPLRHIQFRAPTVSREHARMVLAGSRWIITNHSRTNPVIVNGMELAPPLDEHVLADGDQIEMGEVIFRFHEK